MASKIEKRMVGEEEVYTYGADLVPKQFAADIQREIDCVTKEIAPHVQGIVDMVTSHIPGLDQTIVILCSKEGGVASVVGTVDPHIQLKALENAMKLTKRIIDATNN